MQYRKLGRSDIDVSRICLGTMTFGEQSTEDEAHRQIDYALDQGVNFIDAAEMYPVPPKADTQGRTEEYIGSWLAASGRRDDVVLASKVTGRSKMDYLRDGFETRLTPRQIRSAIEASLERLHTEYLDLYQVHWPDRSTNTFGKRGYVHNEEDDAVPIEETLGELGRLVDEGKVRCVGISNETPWGLMRYVRAAETENLPRVVSIQNPYSLLNRTFEVGLAECAEREDVRLLAYSPLAFGMLTGKYRGGQWPANARLTLFKHFARYTNDQATEATEAYCRLAEERGVSPTHLALQFVTTRPFVTSNIIGATNLNQLRENLDSVDMAWDKDLEKELEAIHTRFPYPAP